MTRRLLRFSGNLIFSAGLWLLLLGSALTFAAHAPWWASLGLLLAIVGAAVTVTVGERT